LNVNIQTLSFGAIHIKSCQYSGQMVIAIWLVEGKNLSIGSSQ
jgi:hypothetical protein